MPGVASHNRPSMPLDNHHLRGDGSSSGRAGKVEVCVWRTTRQTVPRRMSLVEADLVVAMDGAAPVDVARVGAKAASLARLSRSEEHTSELQSRRDLVCRLLLEKK